MQHLPKKLKIVYNKKLTQVNILNNFNNINKKKMYLYIYYIWEKNPGNE